LKNAEALEWPIHDKDTSPYLEAPGGYRFYIVNELQPTDSGMPNFNTTFKFQYKY
jgi:hypothetical protein